MTFSLQPRVVYRLFAALLLALSFQLATGPAFAVKPDEMLEDPKLEARARDISEGLRCLVCQNQSIDDSDAPLARDLRILVRERLSKGDTDQRVKSFLVDRYGEFVLLKPTFSSKNLLLWAFGPLVLILGVMAIFLFYRRNRMIAQKAEVEGKNHLSEAEQERLNAILSDDEKA
ncbi:cytochrome c-type biogenesis protein CcmH [Cohaesibacter marisflavi]|uniref:Cytochrome c-type biogenesis protein n=1 Tax=Cohaesibacter marisflavi TaxID=655353 RepID=A0A1I5A5K7_9HYPH|nr:cytochrome c-type biogenesis protein [Cohaesibacter marisflavi]SFN57717.1 cytochrome c-type biogenesis protein CcmH [Cohaesibacter marisflavi]